MGLLPASPAEAARGRETLLHASLALLLLLAVLTVLALISPALAEHLLFFPGSRDPGPPPSLAGTPGQRVDLRARDGAKLYAWWYGPEEPAGVVLFLHGNAGHLGQRAFVVEELVRRRLAVLLLEYRGYGGNPGSPTIEGVILDAEAGLEEAVRRAGGPGEVVVLGRSLGGAVGMVALDGGEVAGVILESTFTSLEEVAASAYPWLPRILFRRLRGLLDARAEAERLEAPLLVVHGTDDALVPAMMGRELVDAARGPAEWHPVAAAGHNDLHAVAGAEYFDRVRRFVREAVQGRGTGSGS